MRTPPCAILRALLKPLGFHSEFHMNEAPENLKPLDAQFHRLYELEARIRKLDPWKWLTPADIFCIQFEGREPLFVCFHSNNDAKTVDIASGWSNYAVLLHVHTHKIHYPGFYFETKMFQTGRLDPARMFPGEVENYERHGPAERGKDVPFFRSHNIGFAPWPVNREEAALLCEILYAIFGMAMRLEDFREPVGCRVMREVYTVSISKDGAHSAPQWVPVPAIPPARQPDANLPGELLQRVSGLPRGSRPMEIEHILLPLLPGKYPLDKPPQTTYLFLLATALDERRAEILLINLHADGDTANVWSRFPGCLLEAIISRGVRPPEFLVTDSRLMSAIRPLTEILPFKLTRAEQLPIIGRESPEILKKLAIQGAL